MRDGRPEGAAFIEVVEVAKLPALFEEWVRREGKKVFCEPEFHAYWVNKQADEHTHQAYLILCEELKK